VRFQCYIKKQCCNYLPQLFAFPRQYWTPKYRLRNAIKWLVPVFIFSKNKQLHELSWSASHYELITLLFIMGICPKLKKAHYKRPFMFRTLSLLWEFLNINSLQQTKEYVRTSVSVTFIRTMGIGFMIDCPFFVPTFRLEFYFSSKKLAFKNECSFSDVSLLVLINVRIFFSFIHILVFSLIFKGPRWPASRVSGTQRVP